MGLVQEIRDDLLALAVRDGAVIEQYADGSRRVIPVTPPEPTVAPQPAVRPAEQRWTD